MTTLLKYSFIASFGIGVALAAGCRADDPPLGEGAGAGGESAGEQGGESGRSGSSHAAGASAAAGDGGDGGAVSSVAGAAGDPGGPPDAAARRFFLSTPEATNTVAPRVDVDDAGGIHVAYAAYAGGRAFYAHCKANCGGSDDLEVVTFEVGDSISNVALAVAPGGRPRIILAEFDKVYFAACDVGCADRAHWRVTPIFDHDNRMEVSGAALTLDAQGRPRFLMHTYVATLGVHQEAPETFLASCDESCDDADSWRFDRVAEDIWQYPEMRFDSRGRLHVVAGKVVFEAGVPSAKLGTHFICDDGCEEPESWRSVPLGVLFENTVVKPSISLALTAAGDARIALLMQDDDPSTPDGRSLAYATCDGACEAASYRAAYLSQNAALRSGVSIALDHGSPRVAFTLDYNIGVYHCEADDCTDADWELTKVEFAGDLPADDVFLFPGCSAGAWFLDSPSLALDRGALRVGYRAYDVSGATQPPLDPSKPRCTTGLDFTWSRLATLPPL